MCRLMVVMAAMVTALQLAGSAARAQEIDEAKLADIVRLLDVVKIDEMMLQMIAAMEEPVHTIMKAQAPQLTDEHLELFDSYVAEGFRDAMPEILMEFAVIYDRHLSHEQILELIAFYESPTGRHLLEIQPTIQATGVSIGQRWGQAIGMEAGRRLGEAIQQGL